MNVKVINSAKGFSGTVIIPAFETSEKNLIPISFNEIAVASRVFYGKKDTTYAVATADNVYLFIGLGKSIEYKALKTTFRRIASKQKDMLSGDVVLAAEGFTEPQIEAIVSGLLQGTYTTGLFKTNEPHPFLKSGFTLNLIGGTELEAPAQRAVKIAGAQNDILRLVDLPPNVATPEFVAGWISQKGQEHGFSVNILGREEAISEGLHAFMAVGQGSRREPQFVIIEYNPEILKPKTPHVGLVGKGITYDTGGLNIKTAGMVHMKSDMAGGAAVLGTICLIAKLALPIKVTAIVPLCENAIGPDSFYPGDVIKSYSGHSIEIIDTDAEGRLILADGLSYLIKNYKPDTIIDIATLTGSSVGTFGYECGALFTNDKMLEENLRKAGEETGERLWPLPLWDEYKPDIESDIADVKNYSGKPVAGAISAAKFLEYFTNEHKSWAHLDVAGVAFGDGEFSKSKHATAFGVHLLTTFIENLTHEKA